MNKKRYLFLFFIILFIILYFRLTTISNSAYLALISTIFIAFDKIKTWLIRLATPAAAVAIGTGLFMRKFSFGDEEKIRTGKNLVKGSIFSYAFILLLDLILSAVQGLLG